MENIRKATSQATHRNTIKVVCSFIAERTKYDNVTPKQPRGDN